FTYRWYLFGHVTPLYFGHWAPDAATVLRGLGSLLGALVFPVNALYAGSLGGMFAVAAVAISGIALIVSVVWQRPPLPSLAVCACVVVVAAIPGYKLLGLLADPSPTNSRFAYMPSLGLAAGLGIAATWRTASQPFRWSHIVVPTLLIGCS